MKKILISLSILPLIMVSACSEVGTEPVTELDLNFDIPDWSTDTHSKSADPNFEEVFDDTEVKRLDLVISEENWQVMLDDMTSLYGEFGGTTQGPPGGGPPGGGPPIGNTDFSDPVFVSADIFYNDLQWYKVGVRFKGNSSLQSSWASGTLKLSLKLDFDEFEDSYPQIENQRFYGFKKLSLKNNFEDSSFLREKVAAEIFAEAGLAVSHAAFYEVWVDRGAGPEYFGLYTLVEEVDDTVLETQFSNKDGNLYKPENSGASFALGTFNESDFTKKTNSSEADWSDIQDLFNVLHSNTRTSDPESWRSELDAIFNTDVFLKYLAVNTVIQNWDTYGRMTHNYYLYNDPATGLLTWIPWDNNEALQQGKMGGSLDLDFSNLQQGSWPLIEYLYTDAYYRTIYDNYLDQTITEFFEPGSVQSRYDDYAALVESYATSERTGFTFLTNPSQFQTALADLIRHADNRASAVVNYLN